MTTLVFSPDLQERMIKHAAIAYPCEACGFLAGRGNVIMQVIPLENMANTPETQFKIHRQAFETHLPAIRADNQRILAIYHSHPDGPPIPSPDDRQQAPAYGDCLHVIIGYRVKQARLAAWRIDSGRVDAVDLVDRSDYIRPSFVESPAQRWAILIGAVLLIASLIVISVALLPPAPELP
jgi:[CysO sulfur-carrier protein]-S-L-cysteine hydrolase